MSRRRREHYPSSPFNLGTLINVISIPLLTGGITVGGFYYVTNYRLDQNSKDIQAEVSQREKTSAEFFKQMASLNDGIAKLNTNVAVQAAALDSIKDALRNRR